MEEQRTLMRGVHGLRGLAVALVILYHLHVARVDVPGGWIGVDMFFVISGYLITTQLLGGVGGMNFYLRRAARILPALWLVLLAYVLLDPLNRGDAHGVEPAALFVSNLSMVGDIPLRLADPLQHTWSLAEEEQFYLVWPLLLVLVPLRGRSLAALLTLACAGVLTANFLLDGAYMDPVLHEAPLLAGCALAAVRHRCDTRVLGWIGVGLLTVLLVRYSDRGYSVLEPFATAAAVLLVAGAERLRFLFERPFQWLGTYSYGLYLWHVPVLFALNTYVTVHTGGGGGRMDALVALALPLTALLAVASYHLVEVPVRNAVRGRRAVRAPSLVTATE